ncbi:MAG TPA: aminotransferase class IV [Kofleriaceae bacterium]|jgi:D-alanine transaminase|nr:aminotransferase class IV [Kofleriaceae bacterium]
MTTVYLNGEYLAKERALISVDDRGFLFGDGIYEGVRAIEGHLFAWEAHAARMANGLAGLRIQFGAERVAALREICSQLLHDNGLTSGEAFLYLAVTRGAAPRTHHFPPADTPPTVLVSATKVTPRRDLPQNGSKAITFEDMRWARCDWKTVNLLGSVLARQAAAQAGAYEAILLRDGIVTEGAASTVFAVIDGVVRTHPLTHRILPGVTRSVVMECALEQHIPVREQAISEAELVRADEIFLCGTMTDVMPVITLDGAPVGAGRPGPIAATLRDALDARLHASVRTSR